MQANNLVSEDFIEFFSELWGTAPFAWQCELAKRVLGQTGSRSSGDSAVSSNTRNQGWPQAIDLPTGSGKTACMDIAIFGLASQANRLSTGESITAPRRVFFVVDRRVIVDEAYERARRLSEKLKGATSGKLKEVADNLRQIAHGEASNFEEEIPLTAHLLRGGVYRSEGWAINPLQPIVVASTVDQVGSRLLFRAYGKGPRTWPIYAGLVANDSLIFLDEAHCAQPMLQTLQAVHQYQRWGTQPLGRSFVPVVMSATPPSELNCFEDISDEPDNPDHPLGKRVLASKPATLQLIENAKGKRSTSVLAKSLVEAAQSLLNEERKGIVIFVNRIATARETHRLLASVYGSQAVLLTGRMRPFDKDEVLKRLRPFASGNQNRPSDPTFVVATQTLEVGADLDFDGLVTECASLDALRQRFGRLNRTGRPLDARSKILIRSDQADPDDSDFVYGQALAKTWVWLNQISNDAGEVDFGIAAMRKALPDDVQSLNSPAHKAPVMLPAHVDCWAQTNPVPDPSPDLSPFFHGEREVSADVQVCWRADLDLGTQEGREVARQTLGECPPSSSEMLPVPIGVFRRWLIGETVVDDSSDVEGAGKEDDVPVESREVSERHVFCWGENDLRVTSDPQDISPGNVIVIPICQTDGWEALGDFIKSESIEELDIGDISHFRSRARAILRLHPKLVEIWPDIGDEKAEMIKLLGTVSEKHESDEESLVSDLHDLLLRLVKKTRSLQGRWRYLFRALDELMKEYPKPRKLHFGYSIVGRNCIVLAGRHRVENVELIESEDSFEDEDDSTASGISHKDGQPVLLRDHLAGVEKFARAHARGCGLPEEMVEAVACAGLLHDLGKADPRFQSLLRGGSRWIGGEPFAKSVKASQGNWKQFCKASGYPVNGRHELFSVRMAESIPELMPKSNEMRELVLHLVESHHGYCRPFAPVVEDEGEAYASFELCSHQAQWSGPTGLDRLDSGVADRYWILVHRYGWWGLAWLEALMRLADWRRSAWEQNNERSE